MTCSLPGAVRFLLLFFVRSREREEEDELIFVGTGVSTALPVLGHLDGSCPVCMDALHNEKGPNRRNNVSILIRVAKTQQNILIDCGKTFRSAFLRSLAPLKVSRIDSLLLTHDHADAIDGLDDLRDLQPFGYVGLEWRSVNHLS